MSKAEEGSGTAELNWADVTEILSKLTSGKGKPLVLAPKNRATALVPSYSKVKLSRPTEVNVSVPVSYTHLTLPTILLV